MYTLFSLHILTKEVTSNTDTMNTSKPPHPLVLNYIGEHRFYHNILYWKALPKHRQRADLLMRIEDELMRQKANLGIIGLNYCVAWVDLDQECQGEPSEYYHSEKYAKAG